MLLGRSRNIAVANFLQLEKKFKRNPNFKAKYVEAMQQYFENQHYNCYYMPHLAVEKADSSSTKTRIAFDASRKSMNGVSLNDMLLKGPTIQTDIILENMHTFPHATQKRCIYKSWWIGPIGLFRDLSGESMKTRN